MKFLAVFLATALALAAVYAGLARWVDPHGRFGTGAFPVVELDARAEKLRLFGSFAAEAPAGALVLGSSRAMKIAPRLLQEASGERSFNFAVDNARAEDYLALYRWARRQGARPRLLLVGLDVEALKDDDQAEASLLDSEPLVAALGAQAPLGRGLLGRWRAQPAVRDLKRLKSTFTAQYLGDALRAVRFELQPGARPLPFMEFEGDGYLRYRRWERERALGRFRFEEGLERCLAKSVARFEGMRGLSPGRRAQVELLAREARADGARLVVFVTTLHPLAARRLEARTGYSGLLEATRAFLGELAREGVRGFDFSAPERYGGSPEAFYDCLHIDERNAGRLVAALGPSLR